MNNSLINFYMASLFVLALGLGLSLMTITGMALAQEVFTTSSSVDYR